MSSDPGPRLRALYTYLEARMQSLYEDPHGLKPGLRWVLNDLNQQIVKEEALLRASASAPPTGHEALAELNNDSNEAPLCVCGHSFLQHHDDEENGTDCWVQFCECSAFTLAVGASASAVSSEDKGEKK